MKLTRRALTLVCSLVMLLALILPAQAWESIFESLEADPLTRMPEGGGMITVHAKPDLQQPTKQEIAQKWATVTKSSTIFAENPSVSAPYSTGELTEEFLETGLTYANYVRFVAGLPGVTLDDTLNGDAQHGAVLLAAIDELTHYPSRPADMDNTFYKRGYGATTSANISARWGYRDQTIMLQSAVEGCMHDNNSLGNLSTAGHRRWLLNPALGKIGFGYAQSETDWSYIVTSVFDRSGTGCNFDFISWPAAGNHPTNLFDANNPWTVTLSTDVYKTASVKYVKITVTRQSDGKQWTFDKNTGDANYNNGIILPYMTVENSRYGLPNCIIFHPGSDAVSSYEGLYDVKITGITYTSGKAAEINYTVDFFNVDSVPVEHSYEAVITEPTCQESGYTTYTCSKCGDSYVSDYTDPVDHVYEDGTCIWCGEAEKVYGINWVEAYSSLGGNIAVVFKADLSEDLVEDPNAFMRFTYAGKTVDVPVSEASRAGNYYNFFCRITSVNMTDDITAQMMVGEEAIGRSVTTSLEKYCSYIISNSTDTKTVNLMKAMLNYGAAAQKMMNYKTDNLANKSLSDTDKVLIKVDATQYKHSITGTEDGIKPVEALLVLGSETTIRVGFSLTGNKTIDQYTFTVDGVEVEPVLKGGKYVLEVPNIAAHRLDEYHTFTCGGITVTYCGLSYVNQVMGYYTEGTTFDMAAALYNYSQATEAYTEAFIA